MTSWSPSTSVPAFTENTGIPAITSLRRSYSPERDFARGYENQCFAVISLLMGSKNGFLSAYGTERVIFGPLPETTQLYMKKMRPFQHASLVALAIRLFSIEITEFTVRFLHESPTQVIKRQ